MFNFDATSNVTVSNSNFLKGDLIHDVMLKSIEYKEIDGKNGNKYQVIDFNYEGVDGGGKFQDRVFAPLKPEDSVRKRMDWGLVPSEIEKLMMKLYLIISVIDPAVYQDIRTKKKNMNFSTIQQLVEFMQSILKGKEDVVFEAKLLKNNNGYAEFPRNFAKISKDENLYLGNIFLGKGLRFSKWEAGKIAERAEAAPESAEDTFDLTTEISSTDTPISTNNEGSATDPFASDDDSVELRF